MMEAQNLFANLRVNVTAEEKIHLGAVIGSTEYRDKYVKDLVKVWDNQHILLSIIAKTQPQAAYLPFDSGFKSKLYSLRIIPSLETLFIPAVTGCHICSDKERV